jgi:hypothetical protein
LAADVIAACDAIVPNFGQSKKKYEKLRRGRYYGVVQSELETFMARAQTRERPAPRFESFSRNRVMNSEPRPSRPAQTVGGPWDRPSSRG